jgi:hypothetical protein
MIVFIENLMKALLCDRSHGSPAVQVDIREEAEPTPLQGHGIGSGWVEARSDFGFNHQSGIAV